MLNSNNIYLIRLAISLEESWEKQKLKKKKKRSIFLRNAKKGEKNFWGERQDRRRGGLGCRSPFGKGKNLYGLSLIIKATHMVNLDHFLISNSYLFSSSFFP